MTRIEEESAYQEAADHQGVPIVSGGVLAWFSQPWPTHL